MKKQVKVLIGVIIFVATAVMVMLLKDITKPDEISEDNILAGLNYSSLELLDGGLLFAKTSDSENSNNILLNNLGEILYSGEGINIENAPVYYKGRCYYIMTKDDRMGIIDEYGNVKYPLNLKKMNSIYVNFHDLLATDSKLIPFQERDSNYETSGFGYMNTENGENVISPIYDRAYPFRDGIALVGRSFTEYMETDWGAENIEMGFDKIKYEFIDEDGNIIGQALEVDEKVNSDNGFIPKIVNRDNQDNNTYVFVDKEGNVLNSKEFTDTLGFYNGYAYVRYDDDIYWSIINTKGEIMSTDIYANEKRLHFIEEGYYRMENDLDINNRYLYYNEKGEKLNIFKIFKKFGVNEISGVGSRFKDKVYIITKGEDEIIYDAIRDKAIYIPDEFKDASIEYCDGKYVFFKKDYMYYVLDENGYVVYEEDNNRGYLVGYSNDIPIWYNNMFLLYETNDGNKVKYSYDTVENVGNNSFIVSKDGKYGLIRLNLDNEN